jgi:hypothetical protein
MKNFRRCLFSLSLFALALPLPTLALGEIAVEYPDGDTVTNENVIIHNTDDILYFKAEEGNNILMITKKDCQKEGSILVCNQARMGLDSYGVLEEINLKEIFLFINPTSEVQQIQGSEVKMTSNTILLEALTSKGTFITGVGKIDSTSKPEGASR